jgi:nitrogen PTS system EIIA component
MRLSNILRPERVFLDLPLADADALLQHLATQFQLGHPSLSSDAILTKLRLRERTGSTGLGEGVAIPHARLESESPACAIVVRSQEPLLFNAPDGRPVDLFFALAVPQHQTDIHLELLAELAELLSSEAACAALRSAATVKATLSILSNRLQEIAAS